MIWVLQVLRVRVVLLAVVGGASLVMLLEWMLPLSTFQFGGPGTKDFSQYWAGVELLRAGKNPYDQDLVLQVQRLIGLEGSEVFTCWAAPIIFVLLEPVIAFESFPRSAKNFFILNVVLYAASALLLLFPPQRWQSRFTFGGAGMCLLLFPGWLDGLLWGQASLILLFLLVVSLLLLKHHPTLSGAVFFLALFKPHLFFIYLIALTSSIPAKDILQFFFGAAISATLCFLSLELLSDGVFLQWITLHTAPVPPFVTPASGWQTATIPSLARKILGAEDAFWLQFAWTGIGLVGVFFLRRAHWTTPSFWLAYSVSFAPYGWLYDAVLVLPLIVEVLRRPRVPHAVALSMSAIIMLSFAQSLALEWSQVTFAFLAPALLLVAAFALRRTDFSASRGASAIRHP